MAIDKQAVNDAALAVMISSGNLYKLSGGMINPVAGSVPPHPDTIAALMAEAVIEKANWIVARDALDASMTP